MALVTVESTEWMARGEKEGDRGLKIYTVEKRKRSQSHDFLTRSHDQFMIL